MEVPRWLGDRKATAWGRVLGLAASWVGDEVIVGAGDPQCSGQQEQGQQGCQFGCFHLEVDFLND